MSYITDLRVSTSSAQEAANRAAGFFSVPSNLNQGTGGPKTYLWYKRGNDIMAAITRIQFSFNKMMNDSLQNANYTKINENLNEGTTGDKIYLWYFKDSTSDVPIIDFHVTTHADEEPCMFGLGWKRLACDLNRSAGGNRVHLWVLREKPTYISHITATINCEEDTALFNQAYIRMDENTNRDADGPCTFIFYLLTKEPNEAIKDVKISPNKVPGYEKVEQDLNRVPGGYPVFLWYSNTTSDPPIQDLTLLLDPEARQEYEKAKITVRDENINPKGAPEFLSYYR